MPILGAHMSIAGGYYKAIESADAIDMDCVQIFTKNNNQWRAKPITEDDADRFREAFDASDLVATLSHASYLINLATPKEELWEKSIEAFRVELRRAETLGVPDVVLHPGSFTTSDEASGIARVTEALNRVFAEEADCEARCLLETTAGQGSNLGWRFEQLAEMMAGVEEPERVAVCLDTCHVFAAGYPLAPEADYQSTLAEFDKLIGLDRLKALHINDSKAAFGSRKDRHEHIGDGEMGEEPFRLLLNDPRLESVPMYLETERGDSDDGRTWDEVNLERLRSFVVE